MRATSRSTQSTERELGVAWINRKLVLSSRSRSWGARMQISRIKATLTDSHLWIPIVVLAIGIALLAALT
jgi:hypothetical protein